MNIMEASLHKSDTIMQGILDDAHALIRELDGWRAVRYPTRLEVWTPTNKHEKYNTFHFEVSQATSVDYRIMYWNNLNSKVRGGMRDIEGTDRDKVFGVISNYLEYDIKYGAYQVALELLKTRRVKYYYIHDTGFEVRYRVKGVEQYIRFQLDYKSDIDYLLTVIKQMPKGKPAKERDMFSSLYYKEWR